jgi:hypothetical protein
LHHYLSKAVTLPKSGGYLSEERRCTGLLGLALLETLLPLFFTLTGVLLNLLWWRVLDELALLVEAGPLGQTVGNVDAALAVKHVESERIC